MTRASTLAKSPETSPVNRGSLFPATHWSLVVRAKKHDDLNSAEALAELCKTYWKPVYGYLRCQGNSQQDAEDLTQGFFAMLLDRDSLASVEESKGRLRSFLLVALKRYAANEYERASAIKRGGGAVHVSLDDEEGELSAWSEPSTSDTPEVMFERKWAIALLDMVMKRLRTEYAENRQDRIFDALKDRLSADGEAGTLAEKAAALGMNEGALKVAVFRMRQRYRRILHEEIASTLESPDEVRDEIMHLFRVFDEGAH